MLATSNKLTRKRTLSVPRTEGTTDTWLTPKWLLDALGPFALDPCHNPVRPFETAANYYTESDDGLAQPWRGRVFLNSPYGAQTKPWLAKLAAHGNGIALIFAKTETDAMAIVWERADALLFLRKRVQFLLPDGTLPQVPGSGAGSVLAAFGRENAHCLRTCGLMGWYVTNVRFVGEAPGLFEETQAVNFPTPWVLHDVVFDGLQFRGEDDRGDSWAARDLDQRCGLCDRYEEGGWQRERDGFYACPDCVTQGAT